MTQEIEKSDWKSFFEKLSKEKFGWETNVQVLSDATGANMLSEGLPFNGITYEENEEGASIEIIIGKTAEKHDSHTIADPKMPFRRLAVGTVVSWVMPFRTTVPS